MSLSIGFDPELSLVKGKQFLPAWDYTTGTKSNPEMIGNNGTGILWDGVSLEVNTPVVRNVTSVQPVIEMWEGAWEDVYRWVQSKKLVTLISPVSNAYTETVLSHKNAQIFGCSEDFSAYSENPRTPRILNFDPTDTVKSFGGHIHIGYDKSLCPEHVFIKLMDLFWASISWEQQRSRRQRFGQPGLFRYKPYGVEYRTPSNLWLESYRMLSHLVGSAVLVHTLLQKNQKGLINLYRRIPWEDVSAEISREGYKSLAKITAPYFKEAYKLNPDAMDLFHRQSNLSTAQSIWREYDAPAEQEEPPLPEDEDNA